MRSSNSCSSCIAAQTLKDCTHRFVNALGAMLSSSSNSSNPVRVVGNLHIDNAGVFVFCDFKDFFDKEESGLQPRVGPPR
ncbi:MAG: hypothetical protein SGPRY_008977 [Prymnesium sp.]